VVVVVEVEVEVEDEVLLVFVGVVVVVIVVGGGVIDPPLTVAIGAHHPANASPQVTT
jgi:hypothetical protein